MVSSSPKNLWASLDVIINKIISRANKKESFTLPALCRDGSNFWNLKQKHYQRQSDCFPGGAKEASQEEHCRIMLEGQAASPSMEQGQQGKTGTSLGPGMGAEPLTDGGWGEDLVGRDVPHASQNKGFEITEPFKKSFFSFFGVFWVFLVLSFFLIKFWGLK